ncbi:MAG TPA: DUF927 domain-containing protein [Beijerinckiaceae bacterium]|nr:DUF927 domain-containing protein [Beijerinckiaceae bacterium]
MEAVVESGNHHWLLGALSGFAGTLVARLEMDTCGLGFSGPSSRGKSTLQKLGAAVFGNPRSGMGLLHTMRSTSNAIENLAARSHATTLQLDELAQLPPKDLSNFIFGLTGGVGKSRQRADSSLRPVAKWSTFVTTSSERGFAQLMESMRRLNCPASSQSYIMAIQRQRGVIEWIIPQ